MGDHEGDVVRMARNTAVEFLRVKTAGTNTVEIFVRSNDRTFSRVLFISQVRHLIKVVSGEEGS
jgi:hypothetical protein